MGKLTTKQAAFIRYFVVCHNGAQAARLAGYKPSNARQMAHENLTKPYIAERIRQGLEAQAMPVESISAMLSGQATANIGDFFTDAGRLDWEAVKSKGAGVIKKITVRAESVTVELYDGQAALCKLDEIYNRAGPSNEVTLRVVHEDQ